MKPGLFLRYLLVLLLLPMLSVAKAEKAVKLKAVWNHTCALTDQNNLYCRGNHYFKDFAKGEKIRDFDLGKWEICAVTTAGKVICNREKEPFPKTDNRDFIAVSAREGKYGPCAIKQDGTLLCNNLKIPEGIKGKALSSLVSNNYLDLCIIKASGDHFCFDSMGTSGNTLPVTLKLTKISRGEKYFCGLVENRHAICNEITIETGVLTNRNPAFYFRQNNVGIGEASFIDFRDQPKAIRIPEYGNKVIFHKKPLIAIDVAAGHEHACAVKEDNSVICWGYNQYGQLDVPKGLKAVAVSANRYSSCAITMAGKVVCWGNQFRVVRDAPKEKVKYISAARDSACAILANDEITCWGDRRENLHYPKGLKAKHIATGIRHACVVRLNGQIQCWGNRGDSRELPKGQFEKLFVQSDYYVCGLDKKEILTCSRDMFSQVQHTKIKKITFEGRNSGCVLTEDKAIYCQELSYPRQSRRYDGIDVASYLDYFEYILKEDGTILYRKRGMRRARKYRLPKGFRAKQIFAPSDNALCALSQKDEMHCWDKSHGPHRIKIPKRLQGVKKFYKGMNSCAVFEDDTVQCWGYTDNLQHVIPKGLKVKHIETGIEFHCAITNDDHVKCWGKTVADRVPIPKALRP